MGELLYKSTRGHGPAITSSKAILGGLAEDGGLYVPEKIPKLDVGFDALSKMSYKEVAYEVMKLFLTDYTRDELTECINGAYDCKFDTENIVEMHYADGVYFLELYHGSTIAFKDMALSILPRLMTVAAKKNGVLDDIVILTATSGDTGKAAMAGFADVPGTKIIVFYPKDGVSAVQERQMVTQRGANTYVVGVHGNFDDAQSGVKTMFGDAELKKKLADAGYRFSSANSINVGRLVPQVVYYVYAYAHLVGTGAVKNGEFINVAVPTGNFGNILAAHYAKLMGTPIKTLICASNDNRVLTDFFETGVYDRDRRFYTTSSPSMDILVSSNLERLIYSATGGDASENSAYMKSLSETGRYAITNAERRVIDKFGFVGGCAVESEVAEQISKLWHIDRYVIDTHTAVASCVCDKYRAASKDTTPTVIASTASPYKFARSVVSAMTGRDTRSDDDFALIDELESTSGIKAPHAIDEIRTAEVRHRRVCERDGMKDTVAEILGIKL